MRKLITLLLISICLSSHAQRNRQDIKRTQIKTTQGLKKYFAANATNETTGIRKNFTTPIIYKLYRQKDLARENVKGIILLSNYDADLNTPLLVKIAQALANENYITAIIQFRTNDGSFTARADTLGKDYENVWNEISTKYGGTKAKTVIGGISFSGFALSYLVSQPNSWVGGIKGIALIAASTNAYVPVPVINKVCMNDPDVTDDYGNRGGEELQNELLTKNASMASLSSCETDNSCTGHHTSDSWAHFFITRIKAWLP